MPKLKLVRIWCLLLAIMLLLGALFIHTPLGEQAFLHKVASGKALISLIDWHLVISGQLILLAIFLGWQAKKARPSKEIVLLGICTEYFFALSDLYLFSSSMQGQMSLLFFAGLHLSFALTGSYLYFVCRTFLR